MEYCFLYILIIFNTCYFVMEHCLTYIMFEQNKATKIKTRSKQTHKKQKQKATKHLQINTDINIKFQLSLKLHSSNYNNHTLLFLLIHYNSYQS